MSLRSLLGAWSSLKDNIRRCMFCFEAFRAVPQDVVSRLGDGDRYEPLLVTFRPASADVRADVPEAPGEALHIARRRGHRQRGQPYERTILPVRLQSHPAEFPGASSATSSARFPRSFPPLVPRTAELGWSQKCVGRFCSRLNAIFCAFRHALAYVSRASRATLLASPEEG